MTTTVLRAADRTSTPWKNGGGVTREIAVSPPKAALDDFDWRISIAEVREPGDFSLFPGVDRCLTVIEGRLRLTFVPDTPVLLDARSHPWTFPGDRPCHGLPIGGAALDLNVMCRRGRFRSEVERVSNETWHPTGDVALLIALKSLTVTDDRGSDHRINLSVLDGLLYTVPLAQTVLKIDGFALGIAITQL